MTALKADLSSKILPVTWGFSVQTDFLDCCLFIFNFSQLTVLNCHAVIYKCITFYRIKDIYSFEREGQHVIVTASSDGYIKMWNLDLDKVGVLNCFLHLRKVSENQNCRQFCCKS